MKKLFAFFAEKHMLANLFTLMVLLLGLGTVMTLQRDIFPAVDFGMMQITTSYPGASPEDVELNVTNKIEDELKNVTGLDRVTSISMENVSQINVMIEPDARDQEKIKRVSTWGISDEHSWKNNWPIPGRTNYPLLFDRDFQPKPAVEEIIKAAMQ